MEMEISFDCGFCDFKSNIREYLEKHVYDEHQQEALEESLPPAHDKWSSICSSVARCVDEVLNNPDYCQNEEPDVSKIKKEYDGVESDTLPPGSCEEGQEASSADVKPCVADSAVASAERVSLTVGVEGQETHQSSAKDSMGTGNVKMETDPPSEDSQGQESCGQTLQTDCQSESSEERMEIPESSADGMTAKKCRSCQGNIMAKEVPGHLDNVKSLGLQGLQSHDALMEVITGYFCDSLRRPDDEWEEEEPARSHAESSLVPVPSSSGDDDSDDESSDDDFQPVRFLADEILGDPDERIRHNAPMVIKCNKKCKLFDGKACCLRFKVAEVERVRLQYLSMTRRFLDLAVLSKLDSCMGFTKGISRESKKREAPLIDYRHHGHFICREFFEHLHVISPKKLDALIKQYQISGIRAREHKSSKELPPNALNVEERRLIVDFITSYADVHAIVLAATTPYRWREDIKLLPANCSKRSVYNCYDSIAKPINIRMVSYITFCRTWEQLLPFIRTKKPDSDLCWICCQNINKWKKPGKLNFEMKCDLALSLRNHLDQVVIERSDYAADCKSNEDRLINESLKPHDSCSFDGVIHYSFDSAHRVTYPSDPLQAGPVLLKTGRKCDLFGIFCEALPSQINFLVDEAVDVGKGGNRVVSMLHYFFEHYGLGETEVHLHAEDGSGQKKNSCLMMYLLWRVLTGRHKKIKMSFVVTAHVNLSCRWSFGLVKRLVRRTPVNCLADIEKVVTDSSAANRAQRCGDERGNVVVPMYDWSTFFARNFRKLTLIEKFHHFYFSEGSGIVKMQEFSDSEKNFQQNMLISEPPLNAMPESIPPKGLDLKRQCYLFDEIRKFVTDESLRDLVAPEPTLPRPTSRLAPRLAQRAEDTEEAVEEAPHPKMANRGGRGKGRGKQRGRGKGRGKNRW